MYATSSTMMTASIPNHHECYAAIYRILSGDGVAHAVNTNEETGKFISWDIKLVAESSLMTSSTQWGPLQREITRKTRRNSRKIL